MLVFVIDFFENTVNQLYRVFYLVFILTTKAIYQHQFEKCQLSKQLLYSVDTFQISLIAYRTLLQKYNSLYIESALTFVVRDSIFAQQHAENICHSIAHIAKGHIISILILTFPESITIVSPTPTNDTIFIKLDFNVSVIERQSVFNQNNFLINISTGLSLLLFFLNSKNSVQIVNGETFNWIKQSLQRINDLVLFIPFYVNFQFIFCIFRLINLRRMIGSFGQRFASLCYDIWNVMSD